LTNKVAFVSGGARGIGEAIARVLARAGASVMIGDVLVDKGQETAKAITVSGGKTSFLKLDVRNEDEWQAAIKATVDQYGGLDILINDAAIDTEARIENVDLEFINRAFSINVNGTMLGTKTAIQAMKPGGIAGRGGQIIDMTSVMSLSGGSPGCSTYSATKGAISAFTRAMALECGRLKYGIRVNAICPGFIMSDMSMGWAEDQGGGLV